MLVVECEWLALSSGELEEGPFFVTVEEDSITAVQKERPEAERSLQWLHTHLLTPGFIDLHTHGVGGGDDVMDFWLQPEYTQKVFPSQGTTSFLASVVFPKQWPEKTAAVLASLATAMEQQSTGDCSGAVLEGVHAEGPIVNDLGAMPPADSNLSLSDFENLLDSIPALKVMTISPHLEAGVNYQRIRALVKRGVVPALGHDRVATEQEILGALACSKERRMHITHLFNVCSFHHRQPSLVNFGLCDEFPAQTQYQGLTPPTVELVGDLAHVHPMAISAVLKARRPSDVIFVSDSILEPKPGATVNYLERKIQVAENGLSLSLVGEKVLAGSCCSLLHTFHSLVRVLQVPVARAVCMLATNPARIACLEHTGSIQVGKKADLLLLDKDLNLMVTLVRGRIAYTWTPS